MPSLFGRFLRVLSGADARERREKEEADARAVALAREREEADRRARQAELAKQRAAAEKAAEREEQIKRGEQLTALYKKVLRRIYVVRYCLLADEMFSVVAQAYGSFKLKAIAEVGRLSDHEYEVLFGEAFKYMPLSKDWRCGVLRTAAKKSGIFCIPESSLPPDPVWLLDGKDPAGYFRGENAFVDRFEDFLAKNPRWYEKDLIPPGVDGGENLMAVLESYEARLRAIG